MRKMRLYKIVDGRIFSYGIKNAEFLSTATTTFGETVSVGHLHLP